VLRGSEKQTGRVAAAAAAAVWLWMRLTMGTGQHPQLVSVLVLVQADGADVIHVPWGDNTQVTRSSPVPYCPPQAPPLLLLLSATCSVFETNEMLKYNVNDTFSILPFTSKGLT